MPHGVDSPILPIFCLFVSMRRFSVLFRRDQRSGGFLWIQRRSWVFRGRTCDGDGVLTRRRSGRIGPASYGGCLDNRRCGTSRNDIFPWSQRLVILAKTELTQRGDQSEAEASFKARRRHFAVESETAPTVSRSRFSSSTFTRGSPRKPSCRPVMCFSIRACTWSSLRPRALATRGAW